MNSKATGNNILGPVSLLAMGHTIADVYSGFIIPILPLLAVKLHFSYPLAGLLMALSGLTSSFLQPVYGYISDKISKRFFVVWGLIISAIFISLSGLATTYAELAFFIIIGNLGVGLYHPQATAIVGKLKSINKNLDMGIFVAGGIIGYALGPVMSAVIVFYLGLKWTFLAAIPGILIMLLIYFYLPKVEVDKQQSSLKDILKDVFLKGSLIGPLVIIVVIRSFLLLAMSTYLPFEWENNLGYSVLIVGIVMAFFSIAAGIASIVCGNLAGKYGERRILLLSFLIPFPLLIISLFILPANGIVSFILYIIGGAILESTISTTIIMSQRLMPEYMGVSSGITGGFCWGIAGMLMYPIGYLIKFFNIYFVLISLLFLVFAAVMFIMLLPITVYNDHSLKTEQK